MNNLLVGILVLVGSVSAIYSDLPGEMKTIYEDSIMAAQQVSTAGDLKSMSVMLSAKYIMDRRLPAEREFEGWLRATFKENAVKDLSVDHWGSPYVYTVSDRGRSFQLRSAGPDGIAGNADDMVTSGP